jgi:hypothetical protein
MSNHDRSALRLGLAAHAVDDLTSGDARDILISVTPLYHAAERIGAGGAAMFREVAEFSGRGTAALLLDFSNRPPALQSLAVMGWSEVETPVGVGLKLG